VFRRRKSVRAEVLLPLRAARRDAIVSCTDTQRIDRKPVWQSVAVQIKGHRFDSRPLAGVEPVAPAQVESRVAVIGTDQTGATHDQDARAPLSYRRP